MSRASCKVPASLRRGGRPFTWTNDAIIAAHRSEGQRAGRPLYAADYCEGNPRLPAYRTVTARFGSYAALCRAAGEVPRPQGRAPRPAVPVGHRAKGDGSASGVRPTAVGKRLVQAAHQGQRVSDAALREFRKVTAHLYWPGPHFRLQRQRMVECCAAFDALMAREAQRRKGGRPKTFKGGPAYRSKREAA